MRVQVQSSKFIVGPLRDDVHTNSKERNTLTDSHIQEQQMHIYRVLSATSTKGLPIPPWYRPCEPI